MILMAKIVHSEAAPAEAVRYSLAGAEFELGGSGKQSYETLDPVVLGNAVAHPWLDVKRDPAEMVRGGYVDHLKPEDDALSAVNSAVAFDPEAVKAALPEGSEVERVAVESGKDQTKPVETGGVAETLAADDSSKTSDKQKG